MEDDFFGLFFVGVIIIFAMLGFYYFVTGLPQAKMFDDCVKQGYYNIGQKQYKCIELTPK